MEKLIELLNEHEREGWLDLSRYSYTDNEYDLKWKLDKLSELKPFIKWLVENEKVEWNNKDIAIKEWILWKSIDNYHSLLMFLAIQDEPIEFLISILK
mgnify:CR=1 FL=1